MSRLGLARDPARRTRDSRGGPFAPTRIARPTPDVTACTSRRCLGARSRRVARPPRATPPPRLCRSVAHGRDARPDSVSLRRHPASGAGSRSTSACRWRRPCSAAGAARTSSATSTRSRCHGRSTAATTTGRRPSSRSAAPATWSHARARSAGSNAAAVVVAGDGMTTEYLAGCRTPARWWSPSTPTAEIDVPVRPRGQPAARAGQEGVPRRAGAPAAARPAVRPGAAGVFRRQRTIRATEPPRPVPGPRRVRRRRRRRRRRSLAPSNCWRSPKVDKVSVAVRHAPPAVRRAEGPRRRLERAGRGRDRGEGADDPAGPRPLRADRAATCGRWNCACVGIPQLILPPDDAARDERQADGRRGRGDVPRRRGGRDRSSNCSEAVDVAARRPDGAEGDDPLRPAT